MPERMPDKNRRYRARFFAALYVIALAGLAVELLVRPFLPGLATGESALGDIIRLLLGILGLGL